MNHNKKNIISALVFSMLSIIAYLITYNNKVLFFLVLYVKGYIHLEQRRT